MKATNYLLLLFSVCLFSNVSSLGAQDTTRASVPPPQQTVDGANQFLMHTSENMSQGLIYGTGIYVNNPDTEYDVDERKLYLDPEFRPFHITLTDGQSGTAPARIQLIDQIVEVNLEGRDLQVSSEALQSLTAEDGTRYVALHHPLIPGEPAPLLEVLVEAESRSLYAYRRVEWREPSQQRTSYDHDNYKKRLFRRDMVYLISSGNSQEIKKMRDLLDLLPEDVQDAARRYVRSERLRNREEDYVQLLTYIEEGAN